MVKGVDKNNNVIYTDMPNWPTSLKGVVRDGTNRLLGIDNSVWVVRSVPMSPIADAKSSAKKILGGRPLLEAFDNLSYLATNRMGRRSASKSTYRQYQLLTVDTPRWFRAPKGHALEMLYNSSYSELETKSRMCLMAVKLKDSLGNGGWASAMDSVVNTAVYGEAAQMSDFDKDYELVANALDRAGLKDPTTEEILIADSWWNSGEHSDTPFVPHVDHMHVFPTNDSLRVIKEGDDDGRWSLKDCADWPETNSHSITMASVRGLDLDAKDNKTIVESAGAWVSDLIDSGAMVVSLRGLVEPAKVTRGELRRNKKSYQDDIREREREGKMEKTEQEDRFTALNSMESAYAGAGAPATLVDTSIIVGINGKPDGVRSLGGSSIAQLDTMNDRQLRAWSEATLCSRSRSNPNPQDLPSTAVACSGVNGLSNVGDPVKMDTPMIDKSGNAVEGKNISLWSIHAGFTEFDRQDAWLSGTAASDVDKEPLMLVAGTTGSGKTQALLWWAWQGAQMGQPQIILDPKPGSDHTEALENIGAPSGARNVPVLHSELSELSGDNDGIFDPLRFAPTPQAGVDIATSLLLQVNPWGDNRDNFSTTLAKALHIGVSSGDRCVGAALNTARKSERGDTRLQAMVDDVFDLAKSSPTFSSCIGFDNDSTGMRISDGITYINVGAGSLELPTPGQLSFEMNPIQRASLALIRMMIFGSSMALTGRNGVLHADEAWTFLKAGKEEIERLGRLARSQGVLPILYTQRVTDATDQALQNYISRGLILGIRDMDEAEAACELFGLDPTPDRLTRITAGSTKGGSVGEEGGIPNFQSLRPLRDSEGKVIRGSVAIYSDLSGDRANTVEIKIPQWFFSKSSTNTRDQRQRQMFKDSLKTA